MKDGLLKRIPNAEIQPLTELAPGLDPDVVLIIGHALQKEPGDRYQELARMRNDLTRARQRIAIAEEQAAVEAASASAETALISQEPTMAGEPELVRMPLFGLIDQAERALQQGQYRMALTIAGRAAALNPLDSQPSTIVARAEAGLLDRGRSVGLSLPTTPPAPLSVPVPSNPAATPSPGSTATGPVSQRANNLAVAVAVMALLVAAFAVWARFSDRAAPPVESTTASSGTSTPTQNPVPPATVPAPPPQMQVPAPAASAPQSASDAAQPPSAERVAPPSSAAGHCAAHRAQFGARRGLAARIRKPVRAPNERRGAEDAGGRADARQPSTRD